MSLKVSRQPIVTSEQAQRLDARYPHDSALKTVNFLGRFRACDFALGQPGTTSSLGSALVIVAATGHGQLLAGKTKTKIFKFKAFMRL